MEIINSDDRPSIVVGITSQQDPKNTIQPLFNGIEEEQIPVVIKPIDVDNIVSRAYQASLSSRLSVGIAFENDRIVVHYKNLQESEPLFDKSSSDDVQLRKLGANAARLVKGIPFKKL
ncbi:glycerol dehydratase reactivase beta/small subunit family protein [Lactobacillus sp. 3B(2020)]|uniref:glycerol dehydratase reactivase beta/small subunit family protein n=1 Tax=Lactobacillus sp. 3B(2020) TaxID=2695882 RepID=UPI0015DEC5F5|nr:glycerol dehydratase reactivase beta/small subunit family protein [Lactobacillus sp. 3B(2020)]QLL69147.1 propanediol dehydratase [Lactobacillus sp. 3B(2020)]